MSLIDDQGMLDFIRRNRKLVMIVFIVCGIALTISMALPGMTPQSTGGFFDFLSSKSVAQVASQQVSIVELQQEILRREDQLRKMFSAQMNTEQGKKFYEQFRKTQLDPDKILDELVQQKIFFHLFSQQHLEISSAAVRSQLEELPYFKKNGVFDPALYKKMVSAPHQFENSLRDQLKSERVMQPFAFTATLITEGEVAAGRILSKKKDFELLSISPKVIKKEVSVTDADIEKVANDPAKNTDLLAYYNRNIREYKRAEEISAKHILIPEADGGEKKLKEVQAEIQSGKLSFEAAAKKYSKDSSNAPKGGDLGFFAKGVMDQSFESAAFALKNPGDVSDLVKSSFGFHLIKLDARKEGFEKKFDDVKKEVATEFAKDQKKIELARDLAKGWVTSKRGPDASQLKAYGLSWSKVPGWDAGQNKLGFLGEKDVTVEELMALNKEQPLLNRVVDISNAVVLVRWTGEKDEPVSLDDLSYQKAIRLTDLYFQKYKKNLEQSKDIHRSEKLIAQVKKSLQL